MSNLNLIVDYKWEQDLFYIKVDTMFHLLYYLLIGFEASDAGTNAPWFRWLTLIYTFILLTIE
jgi:hypothetical protein